MARMIKTNLQWTRDLHVKIEEDITDAFVVKQRGEKDEKTEESLVFDVNAFKSVNRTYGGLSGKARGLLLKHPIERTDEDLVLLKVQYSLPKFLLYSPWFSREINRYVKGKWVEGTGHLAVTSPTKNCLSVTQP